jgi:ubiquinone/menaquinone biosynthesis C-methylase UbiE
MESLDRVAVPNHHAHHRGFSGLVGLLAALTMVPGRRRVTDLAAELVVLQASDRVVDLGCGPGTAARRARRRSASVTGVDPAAVMLRVARVLDRRGDVSWRPGAAEDLPLTDGSATVLWSIASVHHWPDIDGALSEIHRVLAAGGRFVVLERKVRPGATGLASHGWIREQAEAFADRCRTAGFPDPRVVERRVGRRAEQLGVVATRP